MSFLNTLATSRSAIDFFSDRLSLIGTNIASTQTPGYDRQRQLPIDNFYQQLTTANAAGGVSTAGGVREIGRQTIYTVGELASTSQSTDMAINGRGFFPVQDSATGEVFYTRVGSFDLDADGYLRLAGGQQLMGIQGEAPAFQVSLDAQGNLVFTVDPAVAGSTPGTTGQVLQLDTSGAGWSDDTLSFATTAPSGGSIFPVLADGSILTATAFDQALAGLNGGMGLNLGSNYTTFASLETAMARGGVSENQADAALLQATGNAGLTVNGNTYASAAEIRAGLDAGELTMAELDTALAAAAPGGLQLPWATQEDLRAGLNAGLFTEADLNVALASTPLTVGGSTFDGSAGAGWAELSDSLPINPNTGAPYTLAEIEEAAPRAIGVDVGEDGTISWQFSNGTRAPAGWVRLADVRNIDSMTQEGENLFAASSDTVLIGDWQTNAPDAGGRGAIVGGHLELSNVDLTTEFGDLLASQRSFQASSKMLNVMDELLSTVIQMRR